MMKKLSVFLSIFLTLVLVLASCGGEPAVTTPDTTTPADTTPAVTEPNSAAALWTQIEQAMDALTSYESEMSMDMTMYVEGYKIVGTSTGRTVEIARENDFYYYQMITTTAKSEEMLMDQTTVNLMGYENNKMFHSYTENGVEKQRFVSRILPENFAAYLAEKNGEEINFSDCVNASFQKNEDGTWTLVYSGYTSRTINTLTESLGLVADTMGAPIVDMEITITADAEYRVQRLEYSFVFAEQATAAPVVQMTATYSNYNTATPVEGAFDPATYMEVPDIRILSWITDSLTEYSNADQGAFTLEIKQTTKALGSTHTYTETDTVSYGKKNGAYFYDIGVVTSDGTMSLQFSNNLQTVVIDGETYSEYATSADAKATVDSLIHTAGYNELLVYEMTKMSDGVYALNCTVEPMLRDSVLQSLGGGFCDDSSQIILVTIKDGKVEKLESSITIKGRVQSGSISFTLELDTVNTFHTEGIPATE